MLLLKLPQLLDAIALGPLLLLRAIALEFLRLHVVLPLERLLLHACSRSTDSRIESFQSGCRCKATAGSFCAHQWTSRQTCLSS
jgi:hypothetical protein